jgi:hypothetical protein
VLDHPRGRGKLRREHTRIADRSQVVGQQATVGARGRIAQLRRAQRTKGRPETEGQELERHRRRQLLHRLSRVDDDHESLGRRGDDLLAEVGPAAALHQPSIRRHLIGAIDCDVELVEPVERLDPEPQLACLALGCRRCGHATEVQLARGQSGEQVSNRGARPQPHSHPVLNQLRSRFGGGSLLSFGIGARRHGVESTRSPPRRAMPLVH